ncbi:hypothetical protein FDP41_007226 [Naegleria fowleri]|uniref:AB hydrolase-1 domain-containing protein n=1 Tax=Naegleria fowleri TaxID=5763 RepID=A0A6A5BLQ4_NAEFO|nr:uncharacterized protein FDP41_007226 [Naegleria fowleri]KAF0973839.1 hypothetical protein FDP41_007226 [Naegleria fowleri]
MNTPPHHHLLHHRKKICSDSDHHSFTLRTSTSTSTTNSSPFSLAPSTPPSPNLFISCCANTTYMIVVLCFLFGLFIVNENLSLFKYMVKDHERRIDFERQFIPSKSISNHDVQPHTQPIANNLQQPHTQQHSSQTNYHLLFVHGAFGSKEEFTMNYFPYFLKNDKISSVGAFSFTAHGKSSHSNYIKYLRMIDYVNDLELVIEKYYQQGDFKNGNHQLILICHSMGGLVCQKYLDKLSKKRNLSVIPLASMILLASAPPVSRFENILSTIRYDPFHLLFTNFMTFTIDAIAMTSIHHTKHYFYHEKTSLDDIQNIHKNELKLQSEGLIYYLDSLTCSLNAQSIIEMFKRDLNAQSIKRDQETRIKRDDSSMQPSNHESDIASQQSNRILFSHPFHIKVISIEKDAFFTQKQHDKTVEYWNLIANQVNQKQEGHTDGLKVSGEIIPTDSVQVGHLVMLDVGWKQVANKIIQFIQEEL